VLVVTLTQLEAFVLVARLGSVKAAAKVLGVSEPAVSGALAALRQHLGDPLVARGPAGMALTPGGQRLVGIASQMVHLAVEAEAAIRQAQGAPELLRVLAGSTLAEVVAPAVVGAFAQRVGSVEATVGMATDDEMAALVHERLADVALGPRLAGLDAEPIMRCRLLVVASPQHPVAGHGMVGRGAAAAQDWLVDPSGADPGSDVGRLLGNLGVPEARVRVFPTQAAAWAAAASGQGLAPAVAHLVARQIERRSLVVVGVPGTPVDMLWYVSTLPGDRRSPAATKLRRFLATPDAMQAMHRADGSVPVSRFRPPVYVTLWS
jgi:LysR family transcriptional regulator, low CO2-responsive transcriptional regulator